MSHRYINSYDVLCMQQFSQPIHNWNVLKNSCYPISGWDQKKISSFVLTYIHSHTTDTWPAVPLGLVFVVGPTSLQDGLVNTATSSNHTCNKTTSCSVQLPIRSWTPPSINLQTNMRQCWVENAIGSYQQQLCWQRRWLSLSLRAAWLWTSWSQGCGRSLWHSFLMRGPACHGHQASPPDSRWWFPQAFHPLAGRCRYSAELWDKQLCKKLKTTEHKSIFLTNSTNRLW